MARRDLADPYFAQAVVLIVQHDDDGTLGLILNRPTPHRLGEAAPELVPDPAQDPILHAGGPLGQDTVMFLFRSTYCPAQALRVTEDIRLGLERDLLARLLSGEVESCSLRLFLGHAGWLPGQLEQELAAGDWLLAFAATTTILGPSPGSLWDDLIRRLEPEPLMTRAPAGGLNLRGNNLL